MPEEKNEVVGHVILKSKHGHWKEGLGNLRV